MSDLLTKKREWVITGADGLDDLLADELTQLGATGHRRLDRKSVV